MDKTEAVEVYLLDKEQLGYYRGQIDECLDAEPDLWKRRFASKEEVWHNVFMDYVQMWAVCDKTAINCVFMTEVRGKPRRVLVMFWAYGHGLLKVFPCVDLVIDRFAKAMECEEITIEGRRGWERAIRAAGGEFMCSTYRRPVRLMKGH